MLSAFVDGLNRVKRAPWLVIGVWLSTLLLALPLTLVLQEQIAGHLGSSMAAQAAADGVNYDWWNEFLAQTSGVGASFVPAILGFAAVMKNLSTVADTSAMPTVIAITVAIYMLLSLFLAGGVLDRLARDQRSARARSSRRAASTSCASSAWASSPRRLLGAVLSRITRGCSTRLYPALTAERHRRAHGILHPRSASTPPSRYRSSRSTSSSTTRRSAPSSRIAAA